VGTLVASIVDRRERTRPPRTQPPRGR
jgi:hypothetical protein